MGWGSGIRDPGSEIRDPRSGIRDPGSGKNLFRIPDLGQKGTLSRIRICNTANNLLQYPAEVPVTYIKTYRSHKKGTIYSGCRNTKTYGSKFWGKCSRQKKCQSNVGMVLVLDQKYTGCQNNPKAEENIDIVPVHQYKLSPCCTGTTVPY